MKIMYDYQINTVMIQTLEIELIDRDEVSLRMVK